MIEQIRESLLIVRDPSIIAQSSISSVTMGVFKSVAYTIFFLIYFLCQVYCESFEKLLIVKYVRNPGVVKFHETYYLVDSYANFFSSEDLKSWAKEKDLLFDDSGPSKWAKDQEIYCPKIHFINQKWNLYFENNSKQGSGSAIGVATADSPVGPYKHHERPLVSMDNGNAWSPQIAREGT